MRSPLPGTSASQGYEIAKKDLLQFLEGYKEAADPADRWVLFCCTCSGELCIAAAQLWHVPFGLPHGTQMHRGMQSAPPLKLRSA